MLNYNGSAIEYCEKMGWNIEETGFEIAIDTAIDHLLGCDTDYKVKGE